MVNYIVIKALNNILLIIIGIVFLISSFGFTIEHHECSHCHIDHENIVWTPDAFHQEDNCTGCNDDSEEIPVNKCHDFDNKTKEYHNLDNYNISNNVRLPNPVSTVMFYFLPDEILQYSENIITKDYYYNLPPPFKEFSSIEFCSIISCFIL
ncbi:MAG: hypothetical protein PHF99_12075 [Bacteroidales bacterium]|nr:hypothetical protein [Bacteroidales bacterium]MDD4236743.1 hypothetical protein [Bacteroidales bacterium]